MHNCNIDGVPPELLLQIMFYLTPSGIRNLIVNRALRPVCEQGLYKNILIPRHSERVIRLLETFLARPDLALLVRHLSIDLSWLGRYEQAQDPSSLQPNPLQALSLAGNLKSFAPHGIADWIWGPTMSAFRDAVFGMKLTRLEIPLLRDPSMPWGCTWPDDEGIVDFNWDGGLGQEFLRLFQSQPLLEELILPTGDLTWETVEGLATNLKESDIPSLKFLRAAPDEAPAFLSVSSRLERLSLTIGDWDEDMFSAMEAASTSIKLSIRSFSIRVWYHDERRPWLWTNLAKVFGLFPNTESLSVTINSSTTMDNVPYAQYYFGKVAEQVHLFSSLRSVGVKYETLYPAKPGIFDVEAQTIDAFKVACPLLQSLVDPMDRLWTFGPQPQSSRESCAHLVGKLRPEYYGHMKDLPARTDDGCPLQDLNMRNRNIDNMPAELQLRVMLYLSPGEIRNLIVNRALRPICEQALYGTILITSYSERSIRLLETFLARPDLALLVRHLSIDLSWLQRHDQPNPLRALSLVTNLKSFAPDGVARWVWEPTMSALRDAVFGMKLTRLEIPYLRDPKAVYECSWSNEMTVKKEEVWEGDLGPEFCKLFQSQPLLEDESDIPSLKFLEASPDEAVAFLPVAPRLKQLSLTIGNWNEGVFSAMKAASTSIRLSIRSFSIRVRYHDRQRTWLWANLDKVFGLFPNVESLSVTINSSTTVKDVPYAQYYFSTVAEHVYLFPALLRSVRVEYETLYPLKPGIFDVDAQTIDEFKATCPLLKSLVDPMDRLWTFGPQHQGPGGCCAHLVGKLRPEYYGHQKDLPARTDDNA
ncbi:hypothetical protein FRB90_009282 [Tulasnella sp. 427]|nr:hypothetical protein FRB90_009282 [Tulasnella sp. 427]